MAVEDISQFGSTPYRLFWTYSFGLPRVQLPGVMLIKKMLDARYLPQLL